MTAKVHHTQRKLDDPVRWSFVEKMFKLRWSPDQIAHALREEYPEEPSMHVSHETIYAFLYIQGRGELMKELTRYLRQQRPPHRARTGQKEYRGKILNMTSIHQHPPAVADRTVSGHWEGDLVMGAKNQSAQVYFADPHSPWMRGPNENTNGLIRNFFPKGTDFSKVTTLQNRRVQRMLNECPRETPGWRTSKDAFSEVLQEC